MELRYGREVTLEDVERELEGLSRAQRKANLIEGVAKDGRGTRLPGPLKEAVGESQGALATLSISLSLSPFLPSRSPSDVN